MRTVPILLAVTGVLAVGTYTALHTRWGVYVMLDILGSIGEAPSPPEPASAGPLVLSAQLEPSAKIQLPNLIQQPSGIKHRNGAVYISTDQAEIFRLSSDFASVSDPVTLIGGPLLFKQGSLEGIEVTDRQLLAVGEFGYMPRWIEEGAGEWTRADDVELPPRIASVEFSGVTDTPDGYFASSEDSPVVIDLGTGEEHELDFGPFLKEGATASTLQLSGIAHAAGRFYVLSESYTCVLVVDAQTYRVTHVIGLEPCAAADLSLHGGKAYVVIDHNYDEERPPMHVYDLDSVVE